MSGENLNKPFDASTISAFKNSVPKLGLENLPGAIRGYIKVNELLDAYNNKVITLDNIVLLYNASIERISKLTKDINESVSEFDKFSSCILNELEKYKVTSNNLKSKIADIKSKIDKLPKIDEPTVVETEKNLREQLKKAEEQLGKLKSQVKPIKDSFGTKYGLRPVYTLNNALYHEKNNGGIIGILQQVHKCLTTEEYNEKCIKDMLEKLKKEFNHELKKIETVANFKTQGNPNVQLPVDVKIHTEKVYQDLGKLIADLRTKTSNALKDVKNVKTKEDVKSVLKSAKEIDIADDVSKFINNEEYYENVPKEFSKSMRTFCSFAYINRASEDLVSSLTAELPTDDEIQKAIEQQSSQESSVQSDT